MNSPTSENQPSVLVLSEDAADFQPLLISLAKQGVQLDFATTPLAALDAYKGQQILLAQPEFAASVIDSMSEIGWVQSTWAGITPLLKTRRKDYVLTGVKDIFGPSMAEYTLAHVLAREQKLAERAQQQALGEWWREPSGSVNGKTLGIMGTGSIGSHIARVAKALGMKVTGFSSSGAARDDFEQIFAKEALHEFLAEPDYVVAVLPDTPETTGLMNDVSFSAMKPTALFINIGRGNLVNEAALDLALKEGQIAGAVLDVFRQEPLSADSRLWHTPRLIITGHVATHSWPRDIAGIFLDNYQRFIQQQTLHNLIDRKRGY